ncbi:hypothetical protein KW805_01125 [Candidatus Pacearchaeota archaeon]|nr:hypothetical protein [Candidatus Pacearchaeota archaeon]
MNIELVRKIPFEELEKMVRSVPINQKNFDGTPVLVYEKADISLKRLRVDQVNPPTFYLLRKNLDFQGELHEYMKTNYNIDTLNLEGALELKNHDTHQGWTLTPPIIEVVPKTVKYVPKRGELEYNDDVKVQIPLINDGAHRVALARQLGKEFTGLYISGAPEEYPYYAHPNGWDRVKIVDDVPKTKPEKKFYTLDNCYALYRDFGVLGCGAPRNLGK